MSASQITFTTAAFVRSHGCEPGHTGGRGSWAFQPSASSNAYDADLIDEQPVFFYGTLTEAKRQARKHYAAEDLASDVVIAVLP